MCTLYSRFLGRVSELVSDPAGHIGRVLKGPPVLCMEQGGADDLERYRKVRAKVVRWVSDGLLATLSQDQLAIFHFGGPIDFPSISGLCIEEQNPAVRDFLLSKRNWERDIVGERGGGNEQEYDGAGKEECGHRRPPRTAVCW